MGSTLKLLEFQICELLPCDSNRCVINIHVSLKFLSKTALILCKFFKRYTLSGDRRGKQ